MELTWQTLSELLENPIAFHRIFARIAGGATPGLFLSQLYYWDRKQWEGKNPQGWFWKTMADWEEETSLTRTEQETARRVLVGKGILEEKKQGLPAKLYFRLNRETLLSLIEEHVKTRKQGCGKPANKDAENPQASLQEKGRPVRGKSADYTETTESETTAETTPEKSPPSSPPTKLHPEPPRQKPGVHELWCLEMIREAPFRYEEGKLYIKQMAQILQAFKATEEEVVGIYREMYDKDPFVTMEEFFAGFAGQIKPYRAKIRKKEQGARQISRLDRDFERFYAAYPKKKDPLDARKAWGQLNPSAEQVEQILVKVEEAIASDEWRKEGGRMIPYPATFLRKGGWLSVYEKPGETVIAPGGLVEAKERMAARLAQRDAARQERYGSPPRPPVEGYDPFVD